MKNRYCWVIVGFLVTLLQTGCARAGKKGSEDMGKPRTFVVRGDVPFTKTGFTLSSGLFYRFSHKGGKVCWEGDKRCAPPRGSNLPGEEAWGLYLELGNTRIKLTDGIIVQVESARELVFYIPEGQTLEYSSDKDYLYRDNVGQYKIQVEELQAAPKVGFERGVTITSYTASGYCMPRLGDLLDRLIVLGATAVQFVEIFTIDSDRVVPGRYSPSFYCMEKVTRLAHSRGLKVSWKLHVDPPDGSWRGIYLPENKKIFFDSYRSFALFFAEAAQRLGVEYLIPATEMVALMREKQDRNSWLSIFLALHTVYFGKITYAADKSEYSKLGVEFWHTCCDMVSITPWYSLSTDVAPTASALKKAWIPIVRSLGKFHRKVKKRILLQEAPGYRATVSCAHDPADYRTNKDSNEFCQAQAYEAFLTTFSSDKRRTYAGVFLWEVRVPEEGQSDYSPIGKMAERVLQTVWKGK